jgi:hypothetical protein
MTAAASIEMPNSQLPRLARKIAIGALVAVLLYRAFEFARTGFAAIRYPWGLDYGEGIVWQQARFIFTPEAYGPIDRFPAIVFHYTPLYHAVTSLVAGTFGTDELATGRAISLLSTLVAALASGALAAMLVEGRHRKQGRWLAACGASLIVLSYVPVIDWAPLMRVDMLAIALSLLGLVAAFQSIERPRLMLVASLLFVAGIYTKQTAIAAPVATFAVLLATRPKLALQGIATCTALGMAALIVLSWLTDGGFYRHVFLYNVNRADLSRLSWIMYAAAAHAIYAALAGWMVARRVGKLRGRYRTFRALRTAGSGDIRLLIALAYFAVTTVMLLTVVKSGSSINYFLEWCFAMAIFVAAGLQEQPPAEAGTIQVRNVLAVGIPLGLLLQATITTGHAFDTNGNGRRARELAVLSQQIAAAPKPVISEDMVLLLRSGQNVLWEPAIFAELSNTGIWDSRPFVKRIREHEFAFVIASGQRGEARFDNCYNADVAAAFEAAYPVKERLAGYVIYRTVPSQPSRKATAGNAAFR